MNSENLREWLLNTLQPSYEKAYGIKLRKNIMNISSLVSGTKSYLYHYQTRQESPWSKTGKPNPFLLRGAAIHALINQKLDDSDPHEITWKIPYEWKDGTKDIILLGHWDNVLPIPNENVLVDWKTTDQTNIKANGLLIRAKRQLGAYTQIMFWKTGIRYQSFVVIIHSDFEKFKPEDFLPIELTEEDIREGYAYVKRTALEVARELDKEGDSK